MIKLVSIVQCHIVHERCPGYLCDRAYTNRTGGFENVELAPTVRKLSLTCGGCCGRALHRKLVTLKKKAFQFDQIEPDEILVKLSTCITKENYHGPACPHLDYLKKLVEKAGLKGSEDTQISKAAERRRANGTYNS